MASSIAERAAAAEPAAPDAGALSFGVAAVLEALDDGETSELAADGFIFGDESVDSGV